ncbi:MAG: GNAT family N-acetyltransferase [Lysobacter sp.]|nr:GNAT family N-acetyltransferase [Lysobacter sp.]
MSTPGTRNGILIRPWTASDADALFDTISTSLPTLSQWLPWAKPGYSRDDSAAWIAYCQRMREAEDEFHFGAFDTATGALLGSVGLNHRIRAARSAHLGYWVADSARGRGVAVEAAKQAARFGFDTLGLQRIVIQVLPENRASLRVAIKLGAVCEGIARNGILVDGDPREAIVHSLIPADLDVR